MSKFSECISSDSLQFGFKPNLSCSHALFTLRTVCDYFNKRGSNVYIASLDASKAFDKVDHARLFSLLITRKVPLMFINIMIDWYSKLFVVVKWNNAHSSFLHVKCGVRQGGILSPILFNFYINDIICALRKSDLGCHINNLFIGCILYADDILLTSASVCMLQTMLDICIDVSTDLCLSFNCSKSQCFIIGQNGISNLANLQLGGKELSWVSKLKYLGVVLVSNNHFSFCLDSMRRKFFAAVNALNSHCKYVAEPVKLQLYESYCLPILLYGLDCVNLSVRQVHELNVCWNNAYRKIFGFKQWESVKMLIFFMQRLDFRKLYDLRRLLFAYKLRHLQHDVINALLPFYMNADDMYSLYFNYNICDGMSIPAIKRSVFSLFSKCVGVNI